MPLSCKTTRHTISKTSLFSSLGRIWLVLILNSYMDSLLDMYLSSYFCLHIVLDICAVG